MSLASILALLALIAGAVAVFLPNPRVAGAGVVLIAVAMLMAGR